MSGLLAALTLALLPLGAAAQAPAAQPRAIRVVMDDNYPPFSFHAGEGPLQGILIDQWRAWERKTGTAVEIHGMDWGEALRRMRAGEFDVIDTIFETPERRESFDFTPAYASIEVPIFFRKDISGITDLLSLKGFPVAVKAGDHAADVLMANGLTTVLPFRNYEAVVEAAQQQRINVFVIDAPPAMYYLNKLGIAAEFRRSAPINVGEFHRAVRRGDAALLRAVVEGFAAIPPGELKQIDEKWLGRPLEGGRYLAYAAYAAAGALLIIGGLVGWNRALRRMILHRTAALQESEERFRQLAESIHEVFWLTDPTKQTMLYVSPAYEDIWGRPCASVYASPELWLEAVHPDDRERVRQAAVTEQALGAYEEEYRIIRPDGSTRWIRDRAFPVRNAAGDVYRIAGVAEDITERRRTEDERRASERRFREMLENVELIAMTLDRRGAVTFCNDFLLRLTGWTRDEVIGHLWFDRFLPDPAATQALFFDAIEKGTVPPHHQNPIKTRAGELRLIVWSNTVLRDGSGSIVGTASLGEDVTERSRAEAALRESEAQFRQVVENIREVFWIIDPRSAEVLYISPAYERIWGRSCASLYAAPGTWLDAIHPDDRVRILRAERGKLAGGTYDEEFRVVQPDGSIRWVHDRASPVRNAAGVIHRFVGVAEDITARKHLEEQFRQAQKMEAIGTLAGGIAHDFNNILAAIVGYAELARLVLKENPDVREHLGSVLQAAGRATDLVRQILAFSRQQQAERLPIPLGPVVAESLKLLRATLPASIEFDTSLGADAPMVLADATQVHQLLMNLGTNAWHAMRDRTGRLDVRLSRCVVDAAPADARPQLSPGVYAHVSVGDTGCGMDQTTRRRMFEPFFTTKPPGEGTGLGLAVVHGIMNSHDGAVTVESEPREGTVFHLYFPACAGVAAPPAAEESAVPRGHGERVLLVDDEEVLARLGQKTLTALGYEVEVAVKPAAAVDMVRADPERFALVVTDQTMPGMTGLFLAEELLQIRPGLPIILTTGYAAALTPERVEALGIRQLLLKPTTMHSLGAAVQAALTGLPH